MANESKPFEILGNMLGLHLKEILAVGPLTFKQYISNCFLDADKNILK